MVAGVVLFSIAGVAIFAIGLLFSNDKDATLVSVIGAVMIIFALMMGVSDIEAEAAYGQGVLDHAAGLVQIDSTWESRVTIKRLEE